MTKPKRDCVPPSGVIATTLEGAAAALSLSPVSYKKLMEANYLPRGRIVPIINELRFDLEEVKAAYRRFAREGDRISALLTPMPLNDDDPYARAFG